MAKLVYGPREIDVPDRLFLVLDAAQREKRTGAVKVNLSRGGVASVEIEFKEHYAGAGLQCG